MKRLFTIFYFCLLQFVLFVSAQNRPNITPLENGFIFPNQTVEENSTAFNANSLSCGFNFTRFYKYYSFKANFDMAFAFDLVTTSSDFKFIVWKLDKSKIPEDIFTTTPTILPQRTVENTILLKGMREDETDICEGYNSRSMNGFVKAMWCEDRACEDTIKEKLSVTSRCMPFTQETIADTCVCCGKPAKKLVYWGKAY